jgi:hypothetical protein
MIVGFKKQFEEPILNGTKKHTIREDKKERHGGGATLHLATGVRTKSYRCLKKVLCTSVQKIEIIYVNGIYNDVFVYLDGRELSYDEVTKMAKNDGFNSQDSFFEWFNKDFSGKIIHWTKLRY